MIFYILYKFLIKEAHLKEFEAQNGKNKSGKKDKSKGGKKEESSGVDFGNNITNKQVSRHQSFENENVSSQQMSGLGIANS